MRLQVLSKLVMLEQTLFGLPWVLTGAILPFSQPGFLQTFPWHNWGLWFWILFAFVGARTAGMSFNRLIDREIDLANPRTRNRPLPRGEISPFQVTLLSWLSIFIFIFSCAMINPTCFMLSPLIVILLWGYSYTKRFTPFCHLILGLIQFFGPFFAWVAITGTWGLPPILLGLALMASIAANDIVYALQDKEFDTTYRLYSIPVAFGTQRSLLISEILHFCTVILLTLLGWVLQMNAIYYIGVLIIACVYLTYYRLLNQEKDKGIYQAFFRCNSLVALCLLVFSTGAVLWNIWS